MPTVPNQILAPTRAASFHLLLLSEGFLDADKAVFENHCKAITDHLVKIDPFVQMRSQLSVSSVFVASQERRVGAAPRNTAFRFFMTGQNELRTRLPGPIVDLIRDISPVSLGRQVKTPIPVTGADVWLSAKTQTQRAVCVVVQHHERAIGMAEGYTPADLDVPEHDTPLLRQMVPLLALSMWPRLPGLVTAYSNPDEAAAGLLARHLGLLLGLLDESERADQAREVYNVAATEPNGPNVVADGAIRVGGQISANAPPWRPFLVGVGPVSTAVTECDHLGIIAGEPPDDEMEGYQPLAEIMGRAPVLLRHAHDGDPADTASQANIRYDTPGRRMLHSVHPHLIEGGYGFRRAVYRPTVECLMRSEGVDVPTADGRLRRTLEPFCLVCVSHVRTRLGGGAASFQFKGVQILGGPIVAVGTKAESPLAKAFVKFINEHEFEAGKNLPGPPEDSPRPRILCIEATVYRLEKFFAGLNWKDVRRIKLGLDPQASAPVDPNYHWYCGLDGKIAFPIVVLEANALTTWRLATSDIAQLAANVASLTAEQKLSICLGVPGVARLARYATLVNEFEERSFAHPNGQQVRYTAARALTEADLDNVAPGSLLQMWKKPEHYRECVEYVLKGGAGNAPAHTGHSLVYMGKAGGKHRVADQVGIAEPLREGWRADYEFWIVAQWHDALNVPQ